MENHMEKDRLVAAGIGELLEVLSMSLLVFYLNHWVGPTGFFFDYSTMLFEKSTYADKGFWGFLMGVITEVAVCIIYAILFAYIIKFTSSRYIYIKGLGYGFVLWMLLSALGTMYNIPLFDEVPLDAAYTTLFTALAYGLAVAWVLKIMESRTGLL